MALQENERPITLYGPNVKRITQLEHELEEMKTRLYETNRIKDQWKSRYENLKTERNQEYERENRDKKIAEEIGRKRQLGEHKSILTVMTMLDEKYSALKKQNEELKAEAYQLRSKVSLLNAITAQVTRIQAVLEWLEKEYEAQPPGVIAKAALGKQLQEQEQCLLPIKLLGPLLYENTCGSDSQPQ